MFDFTKEELELLSKEELITLALSQQKLLIQCVKQLDDSIKLLTEVKEKM